jgi:hypothetical protein
MEAWRLKMEPWRVCTVDQWSLIEINQLRGRIRIRIRSKVKIGIRIRILIKVIRIRITAFHDVSQV